MWRNPLQVFKVIIVLFIFITTSSFAQSIDFPQMPDMPQMPSMGSSFYKPNVPYYTDMNNAKQDTNSGDEKKADKKTQILSDGRNPTDAINSLLTENNILSALDINSLYDAGLFGDISSLNNVGKLNNVDNTTEEILNEILEELQKLKKEQNGVTSAQKESLSQIQEDSQNFKIRNPDILRFRINGYDLKPSLTTIFFSESEENGSFLLTADRKYNADNKKRTETFYMLFKAIDSNSGVTTFEVIPSIAQDYENKNSFIFRMCEQKNLLAEKTGNLVVIHSEDKNFKMDMLLDIDK